MSKAKVIIVGCGIAGPVLATFLKLKGYEPVVYERIDNIGEAGICHLLQPNGLRILAQIPGLVERFPNTIADRFALFSTVPGHEGDLGTNNAPSTFFEEFGFSLKPIIRTVFHRTLVECAQSHGVEIKWGHKLTDIEETEDEKVRVVFENGASDLGSFVVGCDGLHSNTRISIFGEEKTTYTGLTQTSGFSTTPLELQDSHAMMQWFGDGSHFLTYKPSETLHSWAITQREPESKETWRALDRDAIQSVKTQLLSKWSTGIPGKLIETSDKIVKYGCYDRPPLKTWHKGRVVLLGDAAHPTSPHLGQGANQSFEDIHELVRCLLKHNPNGTSPSTATLDELFTEYETSRIHRTANMVESARKGGESRVTRGIEECVKRNEEVKEVWGNEATTLARYKLLYGEAPVDLIS